MATTTNAAGDGIKEQIKDSQSGLEQEIRSSIQQDFAKTGTTAEDLLGEIMWPFVGLHAPAHYGFPQDGSSGSDTVLTDLIIHFANIENQKAWPGTYYRQILDTLHHLLNMIETVRKHGDTVFHFANLYQLKLRQEQAGQQLEDLNSWYG